VRGRVAEVDGAAIGLDERTADLAHKARGSLELGIRPMYLEVNLQAVDGALPADVKTVEDQGSCKIVTLALGGHLLRARLPEDRRPPQQKAWLRFPPEWTRLFADGRLVG
jgi:glycerol transport system ATP-binding protein